jgi:hypothetical protein
MKNECMTKQKQQELLLSETKKRLQKELSCLKKRKVLSPEELTAMREESQKWNEKLYIKKKFTPLEELEFTFWLKRRWSKSLIVEHMIFSCKPGSFPYDQSIRDLHHFGIEVRDLFVKILRLKEENASLYNRVNELQDQLISALKDNIKDLTKDIKFKREILGIPEKNDLAIAN